MLLDELHLLTTLCIAGELRLFHAVMQALPSLGGSRGETSWEVVCAKKGVDWNSLCSWIEWMKSDLSWEVNECQWLQSVNIRFQAEALDDSIYHAGFFRLHRLHGWHRHQVTASTDEDTAIALECRPLSISVFLVFRRSALHLFLGVFFEKTIDECKIKFNISNLKYYTICL